MSELTVDSSRSNVIAQPIRMCTNLSIYLSNSLSLSVVNMIKLLGLFRLVLVIRAALFNPGGVQCAGNLWANSS